MESTLPVKPKKLSYTALERFRFCPWIYYVTDILKQGVPTYSPSISLGSLLHHVIEIYHRQGGLFPMTEAGLIDRYMQAWEAQIPKFLFETVAEEWATRADGERILRAFHAREQAPHDHRPMYIEAGFKVDLRPGFRLTGRIDRIDTTESGAYRVLDYKSSRRPLESLMRPEASGQLALYSLGAASITGHPPEQVGFYYLAHQQILWAPYDPVAVEAIREDFLELAHAIETGHFQPDPQPDKCTACPYQPHCPAFNPRIAMDQSKPY